MTLGQAALSIAWMPLVFSPQSPVEIGVDPPQYVSVSIASSGYEPGTVVARPGDILRFVQEDGRAHNIEFHRAPEGAAFASEYVAPAGDIEVLRPAASTARVGPMLIGEGRVYEIRIGAEMPEGEYLFGCSHHSKWRGRLLVTGAK